MSLTRENGKHKRLYKAWRSMKSRCYNQNSKCYKHYGGRGIIVCDEWLNSYKAFQDWAITNGYDKDAPYSKCTLDRIDVNGNYCPENCRWVDMKTQCNNTRRNVYVEYNGNKYTVAQLAELLNCDYSKFRDGMKKYNYNIEKAVEHTHSEFYWTKDKEAHLIELYNKGIQVKDIAIEMGISKSSARNHLSVLGIKDRRPNYTQEEKDFILNNYGKMPLAELSKILNRPKPNICRFIREQKEKGLYFR